MRQLPLGAACSACSSKLWSFISRRAVRQLFYVPAIDIVSRSTTQEGLVFFFQKPAGLHVLLPHRQLGGHAQHANIHRPPFLMGIWWKRLACPFRTDFGNAAYRPDDQRALDEVFIIGLAFLIPIALCPQALDRLRIARPKPEVRRIESD